MTALMLESWLWMVLADILMTCTGISSCHLLLHTIRARPLRQDKEFRPSEAIVRTVDLACVFYFKRVKCLQRSLVTTLLLRRNGWNAEMVFAVQPLPLKNHAWVEVEGQVVNDKPYMPEMYQEIDRR